MVSDTEAWKPGQDTQAVATARLEGQDPAKVHCPAWGVIGNLGDSICYAGVPAKVDAIQAELRRRVVDADLPVRVIAPGFAGGISDGQRNGTPQMRYSLIGRETTNDGVCLHLEGSDLHGVIAVVACDKPPVGTLAALLEHNAPAVIMSDGSIRPGIDSLTGEPIDIISCFQAAADSPEERRAAGAGGLAGPRQLRRHVHLQHHAVVHRDLRHGTAAHGQPGLGGSPPHRGIPRPAARHAGGAGRAATSGRAISSPRRRCATPPWWPSPWAAPPTSCCTRGAGPRRGHRLLARGDHPGGIQPGLTQLAGAGEPRPFGRYSMVDIDAKAACR